MLPLPGLTEGTSYVLKTSESYVLLCVAIIFYVAIPFSAHGCVKRETVYYLEVVVEADVGTDLEGGDKFPGLLFYF